MGQRRTSILESHSRRGIRHGRAYLAILLYTANVSRFSLIDIVMIPDVPHLEAQ